MLHKTHLLRPLLALALTLRPKKEKKKKGDTNPRHDTCPKGPKEGREGRGDGVRGRGRTDIPLPFPLLTSLSSPLPSSGYPYEPCQTSTLRMTPYKGFGLPSFSLSLCCCYFCSQILHALLLFFYYSYMNVYFIYLIHLFLYPASCSLLLSL